MLEFLGIFHLTKALLALRLFSNLDFVQGDSGEKVNILGTDSKSLREKEVNINMCLILNGYRERERKRERERERGLFEYTNKKEL
jgi:hypothetical protein